MKATEARFETGEWTPFSAETGAGVENPSKAKNTKVKKQKGENSGRKVAKRARGKENDTNSGRLKSQRLKVQN